MNLKQKISDVLQRCVKSLADNDFIFAQSQTLSFVKNDQTYTIDLPFEINHLFVSKYKTVIACGHQVAAIWIDIYASYQKYELFEGLQVSNVSNNLILHDNIINYYPLELESGIFDISSLKYIWKEKVGGSGDLTDTTYLRRNRVNSIESISILNGSPIWQREFDFRENNNLSLNKLICIAHGNAWYSTKNNLIYVIEISTGTLIKIFDKDSNMHPETFSNPIVATVNSSYSEIVGVYGNKQWLINTETFKVDKCELQIDSLKIGCPYSECFFQGDAILIDKVLGRLILYNYCAKSIRDEYILGSVKDEIIFPMELVVNANEILVIDNKNNLNRICR